MQKKIGDTVFHLNFKITPKESRFSIEPHVITEIKGKDFYKFQDCGEEWFDNNFEFMSQALYHLSELLKEY